MTSAFDKQQTPETIRQNVESWASIHMVSDEQAEKNRREYRAEKVRKYKIRLINEWRAKRKGVA